MAVRCSDRGGERAAIMLTLIQTAKLNDVDPQAWLADVLARTVALVRSTSNKYSYAEGRLQLLLIRS